MCFIHLHDRSPPQERKHSRRIGFDAALHYTMLLKAGAAASYYRHEVSLTHESRPWAHTAASCHFLKGRVAGEEC